MTSENNQIRISAKQLGSLALSNVCKRCFWIKLRLHQKLPWQIFPGIFSSIDSYSKKITWSYYEEFNKLPPWLERYVGSAKPARCPGYYSFFIVDQDRNIKLTGVPDEVLLNSDNSFTIVDYKTSRFTETQEDVLMPMYKVQLNCYALIGEQCGFNPVSKLLLAYYEPVTNSLDSDPYRLHSVLNKNGFFMPFEPHIEEIDLDPEGIVQPLLQMVREFGNLDEAPAAGTNCTDCRRLRDLLKLL